MSVFVDSKPQIETSFSDDAPPPPHDASHAEGHTSVMSRAIGSYIREARRLSDAQVEQILIYQRKHGSRFGDAAVALKLASKKDVLWALSQQFQYSYAVEEGRQFDRELVLAVDPFGEQAEAFRDLRSQLLTTVLAPDQPRTALAVLSANSGDGKTYFSANMAIALSQLGGRTLLIDADMRTPRQDRLFRMKHTSIGLSGVLSGRNGTNIIQPVPELPSLYLLPVGTVPPNPIELIQRPAFALLLQELYTKFDHIVVDTPAARHGADARVIATKCGSALLLGRRNQSAVKPMQALLHALGRTPTRIAGVLVNEY